VTEKRRGLGHHGAENARILCAAPAELPFLDRSGAHHPPILGAQGAHSTFLTIPAHLGAQNIARILCAAQANLPFFAQKRAHHF